MKVAFDTSVLVAGLHRAHPHHGRAIVWVDAVTEGQITGVVTWHALAELWSVLTRLPGSTRPSPEQVFQLVHRVRQHFDVRPLEASIYDEAIRRCSDRRLVSGVIFDALHLISAEQGGVDTLVTFNDSDFTRLVVSPSPKIVVPPDPPAVVR